MRGGARCARCVELRWPSAALAMASGIRTLQRNAINKMLDLNRDGASDDSKNWNDPWKILVYDAFGRDIISPLLLVADLRKRGITLHLLLDSEREQIAEPVVR